MNLSATYYTAAQIALALGGHSRAVRRELANVQADGCRVINGKPAAAWSFAALPIAVQTELETTARQLGFRNAETLLARPVREWQAPCPLAEVEQRCLDRAVKLQRALARILERQGDVTLSATELENIGLQDYGREFGHIITARAMRSLVKRTLDRDNGAEDWARLEIYLPETPARKAATPPVTSLVIESEFHSLRQAIATFTNPAAPSAKEKALLWLLAFESYEEKLAEGKAPKRLKRALLTFLERNAPFLVASDSAAVGNAIRVNFQRKYDRWVSEDRHAKALADGRAENSGRWRAPELSETDRDKLIARAVFDCGGRVAQAWRELAERRELSEDILSYYLSNPARKSYVPDRIAESVKYEVAALCDIHHGPRQAKLNGPHISRDWSSVHSLDWLQADDFTFPIYFKAEDAQTGTVYMRGQVLLMIDLRSTRILGYVLLSERNYTARAIRTLITKVCDEYGLPRRGFYFENGIWRKAKMITGTTNPDAMSLGEAELGLREFGLKFIHAQLPRAKPVERIGGLLQDLMEGLPGYVGRNEMTEKFERVQKLLREARKGDATAAAQFMNEDQWSEQLAQLCERYNATVQNGKMNDDVSPNATFEQCRKLDDPPIKFTASCRYLLAHHKRPAKVMAKGILIDGAYYYGKEIETLKGQTVLAWIDPEAADFITVTNMNRENAVCVPRAQDVPAMDAPPEVLASALAQIGDFQGYTKARYRILKAIRPITFRPMIADREAVELGAQIGQQRAAIETEQREQQQAETKGRTLSRKLKMAIPQDKLRRAETAPALQRLTELLASDDTETQGTK